MTSMIIKFFNNNFFEKCIQETFLSIDCFIGSSSLFFSLLIFIFNFIAVFKLMHFYRKINFEINLIIFSIFQIIIIQLIIITLYEILIVYFTLIQIFIITLIIRKFVILSNQPSQIIRKNGLFIFLNTINISLFIIYIMFSLKKSKENSYSIILFHSCFYAFSSIILAIYSNSLVKLIKKLKMKQSEVHSSSSQTNRKSTNEEEVKKESNIESTNDEEKIQANLSDSIGIKKYGDTSKNNEIFFTMRKKQIKPLYKINIICSFLEFFLILAIHLLPNKHFEQNNFKIIPHLLIGYIIFYLYLIICLFNVSVNCYCFYWKIKSQYKKDKKKSKDNNPIIDNKYIRRETIIMEKEEPKQIEDFIENDNNNKKDKKKIEKSFYMSSFTEISEDKEEDLFVKPPKNDNIEKKDNNKVMEYTNIDNINNETSLNKDLLEPLNNNNFVERESIPINLNSGINRNTISSISKLDQDV